MKILTCYVTPFLNSWVRQAEFLEIPRMTLKENRGIYHHRDTTTNKHGLA